MNPSVVIDPLGKMGSLEVADNLIVGVVYDLTSISIPSWILIHPSLSDRSVRLWGMLRGALTGSIALPGGTDHEDLAQLLGVGKRTAQDTIYELRDVGALTIEPRFKDGRQGSNVYYLWPATPDDESSDVTTSSTERTETVEPKPRRRGPKNRNDYTEEFEVLWSIYPLKKGKDAAYAAFKVRAKSLSSDQWVAAVTAYAKECVDQNRDPQFIKHGSTFFGPKCYWKDYVDQSDKPGVLDPALYAAAEIYEEWDAFATWTDANGVTMEDNPIKHGFERPIVNGNPVDISGSPYSIDVQGKRRPVGFMS